ncbi:uncharacterized protein LOC134468795 [Engraulis encrasicolus]|uniref:uncharacterized protein LOC134468795 n=1 Tax=Engraulis encrasicolus TaxID=184585 RepID=UPI002FD25C26
MLTEAEGDGLTQMAEGLVQRYREAGRAPPKVLYVDRDCCAAGAAAGMYLEWPELVVRLDIWHLTCRFARGVSMDSHLLYGPFMSRLSFAIFEWDHADVELLTLAKRREANLGATAQIQLSNAELLCHCRRRTRGAAETQRLIQEALDAFWEAKDNLGVALIDQELMAQQWRLQRRHMGCIQDPPGVDLYTKTGEITRGGVKLPVYRCARGSTSLESFHLHLCRFIPGTSASDVHFQMYLLEGLVRWNENRARAAVVGGGLEATRCYSSDLQHNLELATQRLYGCTLVESYTRPSEYTGELIGVEYLYSQSGATLGELGDPDAADGTEEGQEEDEGFHDGHELLGDLGVPGYAEALQQLLRQPPASATPPEEE